MASVCMPQVNYQQHSTSSFNAMLLQQQVQQLQQQYPTKQQQRIAPAPPTKMVLGNSNLQNIQHSAASNFGPMLQKKKYTYANMPYGEQLPSVARRNARERNRVKQVNNGFANLRQHLPQPVINALSNGGRGASKKLSKVDTLRIAVEYIRGLQDLLDEADSNSSKHHYIDESSNDIDECFEQTQLRFNSYHSETSASPAPSYSDSDISIGGAAQYMQPLKLEAEHHHSMQYKFENFDNYDDQPDDEELLDYISSWQEQ